MAEIERQLRPLARSDRRLLALQQIYGVGPVVACHLLAEIGAARRAFGPAAGELFRHCHAFEAIERPPPAAGHDRDPLDGSRLAFSTEFTFAPETGRP